MLPLAAADDRVIFASADGDAKEELLMQFRTPKKPAFSLSKPSGAMQLTAAHDNWTSELNDFTEA